MHQHLVSKNLIIISLVSSFVCFSILICVLLNYISHHSETSGLLVKGVLVVWLMDMSFWGCHIGFSFGILSFFMSFETTNSQALLILSTGL